MKLIWTVLDFNPSVRPWRDLLNMTTFVLTFIQFFHVHLLQKRMTEMNGGSWHIYLPRWKSVAAAFRKTFKPKLKPYPYKLKCQKINLYML